MSPVPLSSAAFADAVLRLARVRGPVVVKLGGSAMEDPAATDACLRSVATLHLLGVPVVLVHGGGKPIDRAMADAGLTPKKVAGRRYTDEATLGVVVPVLQAISRHLEGRLSALGADSKAHTNSYSFPLLGEPLRLAATDGTPLDLGLVGSVAAIQSDDLRWRVVECGELPVIPSLAIYAESPTGWLNVNADTAAAAVAGALGAEKAIFLTDTAGVLHNRHEPASLIPRLTETECRALIASGVIDGGMVPKVEACFEALAAGAQSALILDGRVPYSLLDVFLHDRFTGTEITR
jgi:acetylglutamate kinase